MNISCLKYSLIQILSEDSNRQDIKELQQQIQTNQTILTKWMVS